MRIQRLYQGRQSLSPAIRHFTAKSSKAIAPANRYFPYGSKIRSPNFSSSTSPPPPPAKDGHIEHSPVSKFLAPGYEIGGHLEKIPDSLDIFDKKGLMRWGAVGISLAMMTGARKFKTFTHRLPNLWLRDNCRCEKCINKDTMQRAFNTFSAPTDIMPKEVVTEKEGLRVTWSNDNHVSLYPWEWLYHHRETRNPAPSLDSPKSEETMYWSSEVKLDPPSIHYDEIMASDKGVGEWTGKIRKFGFCFVDGCPVDPEKTKELLERIAFIRLTHYGGFYDFTSDLTMKDTAYTSQALGAHTDNTYFTDPSGLQMFHMLSHEEGTGGANFFVDGFHAAHLLKKAHPNAYKILVETPVPWHASGNDGITITPAKKFPVLNLDDSGLQPSTGLMQVRWNNDDRGVMPLELRTQHSAELWYQAAREWDKILTQNSMQYTVQLEPGRPIIFDNWRVLHGRDVFTGKRRMCGGYINRDDYISRWRNTNYSREEVMAQIL